jgi:hypothetical protein
MQFPLFLQIINLLHSVVHHTSASLTLNENYDPDVQIDTETFLNRIVPEVTDMTFIVCFCLRIPVLNNILIYAYL